MWSMECNEGVLLVKVQLLSCMKFCTVTGLSSGRAPNTSPVSMLLISLSVLCSRANQQLPSQCLSSVCYH